MRHALLLVFSLVFGLLGAYILIADIRHGGQLHVVSGSIGTGLLATSVALAIPMELKTALESLAPLIPFVGKNRG